MKGGEKIEVAVLTGAIEACISLVFVSVYIYVCVCACVRKRGRAEKHET